MLLFSHNSHFCSGGSWQASDLDSTASTPEAMAAGGTGIGLDTNGGRVVAYADPQTAVIKLATDDGGSFESHVVPGSTDGQTPSLSLTSDGKVAIAFFSSTDADLAVALPATGSLTLAHPLPTNQQPTVSPQPTGSSSGPPPCSPSGTALQVAAQGIAFDQTCMAAPANTAFTIAFDNKDAGVPHNVDIYSAAPPGGSHLGGAAGPADVVTGPGTTTYDVGPLQPGTYYFQCDIHPTMNGPFVVAAP